MPVMIDAIAAGLVRASVSVGEGTGREPVLSAVVDQKPDQPPGTCGAAVAGGATPSIAE
jgi:hypothetical protein